MTRSGQTLLFDADDTLWENNVYFERAIAAFISYVDHKVYTLAEQREHLNAIERQTVAAHGYGLKSFRRSLVRCFEELTASPISIEKHQQILSFVDSIAEQQMKLLNGVADTLPQLASNHRLMVVTKGDAAEQREKLQRSGLAPYFVAVEVLHEKEELAYRQLVEEYAFEAASTWMIGNSPKSDINPALAAGLNAVFIPHDFTWVLEHESVDRPADGQTLRELRTFSDLLLYF